jgi:hypothetical protein
MPPRDDCLIPRCRSAFQPDIGHWVLAATEPSIPLSALVHAIRSRWGCSSTRPSENCAK